MIKLDNIVFKAVGFWNDRIFNPAWIANNLISENINEGFKLEVLFNFEKKDVGYKIGNLTIFPRSYEFIIEITDNDLIEKDIQFASKLLSKIFNILPHTPIQGIGFNVNYLLVKSDIGINLALNCLQKQKDYDVYQIKLKKSTTDYIKNIIISIENEQCKLNVNYHFENVLKFDKMNFNELLKDSKLDISEAANG